MKLNENHLTAIGFGASIVAIVSLAVIYNRQKPVLPELKPKPKDPEPKSEATGRQHSGGTGRRPHGGRGRGFYPYPAVLPYPYYNPDQFCEYVDKTGRRVIQLCGMNYPLDLPNK